jgi:hypothetical protein
MQGKPTIDGRKRRAPLQPSTIRGYRGSVRLVAGLDGARFWVLPLTESSARNLSALIDRAEIDHGLAQARATRAMLQAAFKWALAARVITRNPMKLVEDTLPVLPPRLRVATVGEFLAFVDAADALGLPQVADMACLAVFTTQRQGDRLAVTWNDAARTGAIGSMRLDVTFRQGKKKGEPLVIPLNQMTQLRLDAARHRRRAAALQWPQLVIDESTNSPFKPDWYRKVFRTVRDRASLEQPSIADLRDQDWRDTGLSWANFAGCTKGEIGSLSGHAFTGREAVLRHYVANDVALAASALAKVAQWFDDQVSRMEEATG